MFLENNLSEASTMLEAAIGEDPTLEKAYIYLGIIYENFDEHEKAVDILREGLEYADKFLPQVHLNLGNNLFALGNYEEAEESYSNAITAKTSYAEAYLNRANTRVQKAEFKAAVADYTLYLKMKPGSRQKTNIEQVINILTKRLAEEERIKREEEKRRQEEEERRREDEQRRIEEEKKRKEEESRREEEERKRKEEEERRRREEERKRQEEEQRRQEEERKRQEALLEEVLKSLENAGSETTDMSAGSEDIEKLELNLELDP